MNSDERMALIETRLGMSWKEIRAAITKNAADAAEESLTADSTEQERKLAIELREAAVCWNGER